MSRRKQAKPRSLKRDEEWDDGSERNVLEASERDNETSTIKPEEEGEEEEDEDEEEELERAFSRHSEDYLPNGRPSSSHEPDLENHNSLDSEVLGTGSSSWQSDDIGVASRRGGVETPSSCATPTSASFPSEPEVDGDATNPNGNSTAPYPCQFCERTFPRLSYLKKHEQSHGDQMPYRCSWCARLFKHKRSRDRHVKLHTGDRRYRCSHCEAAFSRSDHLKIHMKTHDTQKPYQCTACSRGYNTAAALTSHMQSHKKNYQQHQQQQQQVASQAIGKMNEAQDYGRGSASSHSTSSPPSVSSPSPSLTSNPRMKASPKPAHCQSNRASLKLTCMYCTKDTFSCMQQLQLHIQTMHGSFLNGEPRNGPSTPRLLHTDVALDCITDKRDHPKDTIEKYSYGCGHCTMRFETVSGLREHSLSTHRVDPTGFATALMMCPLCGIPCSSAAAYAEHYVLRHCDNQTASVAESRHNGLYDAKDSRMENKTNSTMSTDPSLGYSSSTLLCGQCGAALKDFESFREHVARHLRADYRNNETIARHPCPKCDASFQEREDMLAHLTKHYVGQIGKEYLCGACKRLYPHPDLLQRHLLDSHAHQLYRCALCRDTFDSRVAIQVHFAVKHSQECRVYRCNGCPASNNENSPGNTPTESKGAFRSEEEVADHVRKVHAPAVGHLNPSPVEAASPTSNISGIPSPRCVFCGISCGSELELQLHLASHSSNLYRCPICREGFAVEFLLDRHIAQVHHSSADQRNYRSRENGRVQKTGRAQDEAKPQHPKRGRSPTSSNNNSLNERDNNNKKRMNYGQQCDLCERGEFANEAELQAHKKQAHASGKNLVKSSVSNLSTSCAYCGELCRTRSELESHMRMQHTSNETGGRHKCNICDEVCHSSVILAEHKLQKHCKIRLSDTCVVCRGNLANESQFIEHVQRHSLESVDPQQRLPDNSVAHLPAACVVCRQTLISELECRLHAKHHLRSSSSNHSSSSSPSPTSNRRTQNTNCCCICVRDLTKEDFVNLPSMLKVCKPCYIRHSQGLPILGSPYDGAKLAKWCESTWLAIKDDGHWNGSQNGERDRWEQERSSKTESREEKLDEKKYDESTIKRKESVEAEKPRYTEQTRIHKNDDEYKCERCDCVFPTESKLRQHNEEEHRDSTNFVESLRCHLCLFEANNSLQLQSHLIEHTFAGCAALSCYICQALFTAPMGLQNHMIQEHGLDARPYDCSKCPLKFFFRTELDHHVLTFHRTTETQSPPIDSSGARIPETNRKVINEELKNVTVKKESADDENENNEELSVDDQIEQMDNEQNKSESVELITKVKTEINDDTLTEKLD